MNRPLRLMALLAQPDDESMGFGPTPARYAAEGVETSLVMATRGHKSWKLGERSYMRAFSLLGAGRELETDLFDGLRAEAPRMAAAV